MESSTARASRHSHNTSASAPANRRSSHEGSGRFAELKVSSHNGQVGDRDDRETVNCRFEGVQAVEAGQKKAAGKELSEVLGPRGTSESNFKHSGHDSGPLSSHLRKAQATTESTKGLRRCELFASGPSAHTNRRRVRPVQEPGG